MEHYTSVETITKCFKSCGIFPDESVVCEQEDSADDLDDDIPFIMNKLSL